MTISALTTGGRITGAGSAALKYDLITALLVTATRGEPEIARLALRLSLVITARFNWRTECFAVGLKELARMWGVTDRTAKREMAAMRARGWIVVDLAAARGRVARHRIVLSRVMVDTIPHWDAVGPDFAARMSGAGEVAPSNVVPLRPAPVATASDGSVWAGAADRLRGQDPAVFNAWFAGLVPAGQEGGCLVLVAPSRFAADYIRTHLQPRLLAAAVMTDPGIREVRVVWPGGT